MKLYLLLCLVPFCHSQIDGSFWWLNDKVNETPTGQIPGNPPPASLTESRSGSVVCCECVPFYLCINGTINTDGGHLLDLRIGGEQTTTPAPVVNVKICPGEVDICCQVPDVHPSCLSEPITTTEPTEFYNTPHPESDCECVVYTECNPFLVVNDGLGKTTIELSNGRFVNHSKCPHSLDVCCYLPDILGEFINGETTPIPSSSVSLVPDVSKCECVEPVLCGADGYIRTDGEGTIELRVGPSKPPITCPTDPNLVCCLPPLPESVTSIVDIAPSPTTPKSSAETHCECVEPVLCGPDGYIRIHGEVTLDVRVGQSNPPTTCPTDPNLVCCLPPPPKTVTPAVDLITSPIETLCECVEPILCGPDGYIRIQGEGTLDVRVGPSNPPPTCPTNPSLVCCLPPLPETVTSPVGLITPPLDTRCECVDPVLCGSDGFIRTDGEGVLELRIGPNQPPPRCPSDPRLVCCLPPSAKPSTSPTITTTSPPPPLCGQRNNNGIGVRILGFQEGQTQFGEFPWVVTLLKTDYVMGNQFQFFLGGASLIHRRVVMTAAHKIEDVPLGDVVVRLGEWDTASTKEALPHQDIGVDHIIIHPGYKAGPLFHDVALLILKEDAKLDYHITPICPAKSLDDINPSSCVINGWGVDAFREGEYQKIMKSLRLPLVAKDTCQVLLRKTRLSRHFVLHSSFICAGGEEGVDACRGDGGGPLACQRRDDPSRYLQVGITAWGIGCGGKDVPGVYVDVAEHYAWIMAEIEALFPESANDDVIGAGGTGAQSGTDTPLTKEEKRELNKQKRKEERERKREEERRQKEEERKKRREENQRRRQNKRKNQEQ